MGASEDIQLAIAKAREGTLLDAEWTLERLLGSGGMATVYAARSQKGARAALKILNPDFGADADIHERFIREGKIANAIDHPARVAVTSHGTSARGEAFLVMELLEGQTLEDLLIARGGKIGVDEILAIVDPVLDLLSQCHDAGIVHRDIKPANIFLGAGGDVRVLDFGVARIRELTPQGPKRGLTLAGTTLGTPSYMSPEQALGRIDAIDGRADVFSVGACMYTALSGEHVHKGQTPEAAAVAAATRPAKSLGKREPGLPQEIIHLVDKAIAFEREERFGDATAMREEVMRLRGVAPNVRARSKALMPPPKRTAIGIPLPAQVNTTLPLELAGTMSLKRPAPAKTPIPREEEDERTESEKERRADARKSKTDELLSEFLAAEERPKTKPPSKALPKTPAKVPSGSPPPRRSDPVAAVVSEVPPRRRDPRSE